MARKKEATPAFPDLEATGHPYQQTGVSWLRFVTGLGLGAAWPTTWAWERRCK